MGELHLRRKFMAWNIIFKINDINEYVLKYRREICDGWQRNGSPLTPEIKHEEKGSSPGVMVQILRRWTLLKTWQVVLFKKRWIELFSNKAALNTTSHDWKLELDFKTFRSSEKLNLIDSLKRNPDGSEAKEKIGLSKVLKNVQNQQWLEKTPCHARSRRKDEMRGEVLIELVPF